MPCTQKICCSSVFPPRRIVFVYLYFYTDLFSLPLEPSSLQPPFSKEAISQYSFQHKIHQLQLQAEESVFSL